MPKAEAKRARVEDGVVDLVGSDNEELERCASTSYSSSDDLGEEEAKQINTSRKGVSPRLLLQREDAEAALDAGPLRASDGEDDGDDADGLKKSSRSGGDKRTKLYSEFFDVSEPDLHRNRVYTCKTCKKSGSNRIFIVKHVKEAACLKKNPESVTKWNSIFPEDRIDVQGSIFGALAGARAAAPLVFNQQGVNDRIARLVLRRSLPFSTVDWPEFRDLMDYVYRSGKKAASSDVLKIPSRRTLVDKTILGKDGYVADKITKALGRHKRYLFTMGGNLIFDGVRDVNRSQMLNFLIQTGSIKSVIAVARVGAASQTAEFVYGALKNILGKLIDFDQFDFGGEGLGVALEEGDDASKVNEQCGKILALADTVWAAGSDSAAAGQRALKMLLESHKVVHWCDVSHLVCRICVDVADCFDEFTVAMDRTVRLFNDHTRLRALLQKQSGGKALIPLSATRFLKSVLTARRLLLVWKHLKDIVSVSDFADFRENADPETQTLCDQVSSFLLDRLSKPRITLMLDVLKTFEPVVRLFDTSSMYTNCFVITAIDALPETLKIVLGKPCHREAKVAASESFFRGLATAVIDKFEKHRKPVFSAGYLLCHLHIDRIRALAESLDPDDKAEFNRILEDTLDVICTMYCRWAPKEKVVRAVPLDPASAEVLNFRRESKSCLLNMVLGLGCWQDFDWDSCIDENVTPTQFWLYEVPQAPGQVPFAIYAARITALDPSSCDAERLHLVMKLFRTKRRNRLLYSTNSQLCFAKVDLLQEENASADESKKTGLSWKKLVAWNKRAAAVSDEEEKWLDDLEKVWEDARKADDNDDAEQEPESDDDDSESAPEELAEPQPLPQAQYVSRYGRKRIEKAYADMVNFDDDI